MKTVDSSASPSLDIPHKIRRIRNVLRDAGYTKRSVQQLLEVDELPTYRQRCQSAPLYQWRTRGDEPLQILVRLFLLRQTVNLDEVRRAIRPTPLEDWVDIGLLHVEGCGITATAELCPFGSLVIAADWGRCRARSASGHGYRCVVSNIGAGNSPTSFESDA